MVTEFKIVSCVERTEVDVFTTPVKSRTKSMDMYSPLEISLKTSDVAAALLEASESGTAPQELVLRKSARLALPPIPAELTAHKTNKVASKTSAAKKTDKTQITHTPAKKKKKTSSPIRDLSMVEVVEEQETTKKKPDPSTPEKIKRKMIEIGEKHLTPQALLSKGVNAVRNQITPNWKTPQWKKDMHKAQKEKALYEQILKDPEKFKTNKKTHNEIKQLEQLRITHPKLFNEKRKTRLEKLIADRDEAKKTLEKAPAALEEVKKRIELLNKLDESTVLSRVTGGLAGKATINTGIVTPLVNMGVGSASVLNPLVTISFWTIVSLGFIGYNQSLSAGLAPAAKQAVRWNSITSSALLALNTTFNVTKTFVQNKLSLFS